jgi:predicted permease
MFTAEEDVPGGARVVVLSEDLWRRRFGGDPAILGRTLRLNSLPHEVVGVLPSAAEFPEDTDLWLPRAGDPAQTYQSYGGAGIGRLKPGVTAEAAVQDLMRAHEPIFEERDEDRVVTPLVEPLRERYVGRYRTMAVAMAGAVAIVLLIACSNVASVMLARAIARQREMGIRAALGAGRGRLLRQLFVENLVYAVAGGATGLGLGYAAVRILSSTVPEQFPDWARFGVDARVLVFALLLTAMPAVLFGLAPAFHAFGGGLRDALHEGGARTTAGARGRRTLGLLIAAEVALSVMLLVGGGLLLRAYQRLTRVDPGFDTENVLTFGVSLPAAAYDTAPEQIAFWERLTERLAALPGVEGAGAITCPPLTCHWGFFLNVEGTPPPAAGEPDPVILNRIATPGYFEAMGIELLRGRFFDDRDGRDEGSAAVIVNETFARRFWPDDPDPIGRRVRHRGRDPEHPWMTVVGVTKDVKHYGLDEEMRPGIYEPLAQRATTDMAIVLRARSDAPALASAARGLVRELDPDLPIYRVGTMEDRLRESLALRQAYAWLLSVFAGAALVLAVGGIYGVTSYAVGRRTREIGIRVALGARTGQVMRSVLRSGMALVGAGMLLGLLGALAGARSLSSLLFGVDPADPLVYGLVALLLLGTALAATWVPARRAARVDPMTSLRNE